MKILVTGAAGFIGSNVTNALLSAGHYVVGVDNLSREGVYQNVMWILSQNKRFKLYQWDVRDSHKMVEATKNMDAIFHFAGQVGVGDSIKDPREDFNINAKGTLNILEGARVNGKKPIVVFASTNKVYGKVGDKPVKESQPLDLRTPYGCSKGSAEQYVLDYSRIFGLKSVVFRMSCIYGNRQFGTEEQGWLTHFAFSKIKDKEVTIYGDGKQIRDALYIDDYVDLCLSMVDNIERLKGDVFNIGGGPANTISVIEGVKHFGNRYDFDKWRPSDQRVYISDISKIKKFIGWEPKIPIKEGLERLEIWARKSQS